MKNKKPLSVFMTDNGIAIFGGHLEKDNKNLVYDQQAIPQGMIENGYIKEPETLLHTLKKMWKKCQIKPKYIRLVVQDQNVLVREFTVKKEDVKKQSIEEYFYKEIGKSFHVPFEKPIFSYQIKSETKDDYIVLLFIADENLLQDYYDVMERLGVKDIVFDVAVSALQEIADEDYDFSQHNVMMVTLYDHLVSIQIIENDKLVFGVIEECDYQENADYKKTIELYIERIANYYKYNMRKGKLDITKTVFFNLNDYIETSEFKDEFLKELAHLNIKFFSIHSLDTLMNELPKGTLVAYASNQIILNRDKETKIIDFELNRINKLRHVGYYVFVLALAIFSSMALLYIPFQQGREEIYQQTYRNQAIQYGIDLLSEEGDNGETINQSYVVAYGLIRDSQVDVPTQYYLDLLDILPNNIEITNVEFNVIDKQITLILSGDEMMDLIGYGINIYETYAESSISGGQWMVSQPILNERSDTSLEVVISYA